MFYLSRNNEPEINSNPFFSTKKMYPYSPARCYFMAGIAPLQVYRCYDASSGCPAEPYGIGQKRLYPAFFQANRSGVL
jgi:hypothetical protein